MLGGESYLRKMTENVSESIDALIENAKAKKIITNGIYFLISQIFLFVFVYIISYLKCMRVCFTPKS